MAEESTATATATEVPAEIKQLADQLVGLTLKQAVDLGDYLKDEYGIEPASGGVVMAAGGGAAAEEVEEQTHFDVVLKSFGEQKIKVIKEVRAATSLGLKEAKELVEAAPSTVIEALPKEEAEALAEKLKEQGAEVEIK